MQKNRMKKCLIYEIIVLVIGASALPSISGNIGNNNPPNTPTITGPAKGTVNVITYYNITTIDPDRDDVYYCINWSDGTSNAWIGPFTSGVKETVSHTWSQKGTYIIKVKARDVRGDETLSSDWGTLSVTMPCSYNIPLSQFLGRFLERFPNTFPMLRYLLGY